MPLMEIKEHMTLETIQGRNANRPRL
ncbi:MAG: hypothetical protein ACJAUD_001158 [Crocinitomicaceae bacterium]